MQDQRTGYMHPVAPADVPTAEAAGACVLTIGEVLEIKGGRFRVTHMGRRFIRLEGLPGVRVEEPGGPHSPKMGPER